MRTGESANRHILRFRGADAGEELGEHGGFGIGSVHGLIANRDGGTAEMHHAVNDQAPTVFVIAIAENLLPGVAPGAVFLQHGFLFRRAGNVPEDFRAAELGFEHRRGRQIV